MSSTQLIMLGEGAGGGPVTYIEDVFSTYLYTGNSSTQTITNGIDLSTKGGLVWIKARSQAYNNLLSDSANGPGLFLISNSTAALSAVSAVTDFTSSGFQLPSYVLSNQSGTTYASWTFRKQPKFFDIVTYTGTGVGRTISHNLGSTPGCMIIKRTDTTSNWTVYHRSLASPANVLQLESVSGEFTSANRFDSTAPTSTVFTLGDSSAVNASGGTYVAYLFAHNAGGFGLTGTDNVISCGSYAGLSTGRTVTLGYEPQWVLVKKSNAGSDWYLMDNMRGMTTYSTSGKNVLYPNLSSAEAASSDTAVSPTATGFVVGGGGMSDNGDTYIYIAIRRGPMKVPTSGTSVYTANNAGSGVQFTAGFPPDMVLSNDRTGSSTANGSRLVGPSLYLETNTTSTETSRANAFFWNDPTNKFTNDIQSFSWVFRRAPSFFDEVCYTGTGVAGQTFSHNLGVAPELMITKKRSGTPATNWSVYSAALGATKYLLLDSTNAAGTATTIWNDTAPTSSVFSVGSGAPNNSGSTYVAYLFASCAGVSKVGSYTGTGATQTINCGFTGGARWVMIKRTDVSGVGGWYVWDTARGMVAGTDPFLSLNSTAAEVNTNTVYTTSVGFQIVATSAGINASGGTYIYLAIA